MGAVLGVLLRMQSLQWLMSTEKEDQPRSARRAEDEARVLFH